MAATRDDEGLRRLRVLMGIAGAVYLAWWFMVELLLPGSFNPLSSRLAVVGVDEALLLASFRSRWIQRHLSALFTGWLCVLGAHYCYLILGNGGDSTWWVGAFITFAATSMCAQSRREVLLFSVFTLVCILFTAARGGQILHSIYVPGIATILLLANIIKRNEVIAREATSQRLQLAAIVESSGDAIVGSTLGGVIQTWNRGAELLFGYTAEEAIGRSITLLAAPGRDEDESELADRLAKGGHAPPFETVRRRKDGTLVDVSVTVSPIRDSAGDLAGTSLVARDVSDRKRAEAEAMRAREAAEAASRELEAFSYSVAHDLRAPLRGIDGFSLALLEEYGDRLDHDGHGYLERVRGAAQKMGRLIDGLLSLSRVTRVDMRTEDVDLSELVRATAERLKEAEEDRDVEFVIQEGLNEKGNRDLLAAAIENLVSNAWKFTRKRRDARIEFGCTEQDGQSVYFLRDNGAGFDMAYASKLFVAFQRLHKEQEFEGTGIGLATVQRVVSRHGGRIWAEAKVGEGACFHFTLG